MSNLSSSCQDVVEYNPLPIDALLLYLNPTTVHYMFWYLPSTLLGRHNGTLPATISRTDRRRVVEDIDLTSIFKIQISVANKPYSTFNHYQLWIWYTHLFPAWIYIMYHIFMHVWKFKYKVHFILKLTSCNLKTIAPIVSNFDLFSWIAGSRLLTQVMACVIL